MSNDAPALEALLTPRQAAQFLAISERSLWGLTAKQQIKCAKIGRAVRYRPEDLRAFVESRLNANGQPCEAGR